MLVTWNTGDSYRDIWATEQAHRSARGEQGQQLTFKQNGVTGSSWSVIGGVPSDVGFWLSYNVFKVGAQSGGRHRALLIAAAGFAVGQIWVRRTGSAPLRRSDGRGGSSGTHMDDG